MQSLYFEPHFLPFSFTLKTATTMYSFNTWHDYSNVKVILCNSHQLQGTATLKNNGQQLTVQYSVTCQNWLFTNTAVTISNLKYSLASSCSVMHQRYVQLSHLLTVYTESLSYKLNILYILILNTCLSAMWHWICSPFLNSYIHTCQREVCQMSWSVVAVICILQGLAVVPDAHRILLLRAIPNLKCKR